MAAHHLPEHVRWNPARTDISDEGAWEYRHDSRESGVTWHLCEKDLAECGYEDGLKLIGEAGHVSVHTHPEDNE